MGLIKSSNAPASLSPFSMRDVETQAKAVLLRARQAAERLLADAQKEAEALKDAARAEGSAAGRAEGLAKGKEEGLKAGQQLALAEHKAQFSAAVAALSAAMKEINASRQDLQAQGLEEVVKLAIAVARRVTKRQGLIDPAVLSANLEAAMNFVVHAADVRVAVHPAQKKTLEEALPALKLDWPQLAHVQLVEDPRLAPGGCRVYSRHGQIDADLDVQLDRVVADLLPNPDPSNDPGAGR